MKATLVAFSKLVASGIGAAVALFALLMLGGGASSMGSGAIGGGGGGLAQAVADTLYCKLTGCTMTGGVIYSGVATDIATAAAEDLTITPGGIVDLHRSGGETLRMSDLSGNRTDFIWTPNAFSILNAGGGTSALLLNAGAHVGSNAASSATTIALCASKSITSTTSTDLNCTYGSGLTAFTTTQAGTCASNVLAIDPQSSALIIDVAAAACTLTLNTTTASTIAKEGGIVRISAKNAAGANVLKLAATNFSVTPPSRCTTTGFNTGQSALVAWDNDQAKWTFLGGCE